MSKKKLLIQEVFERIKKSSERDTKGGLASDLADYLEENLNFVISKRTLVRYYEAYIEGNDDVRVELYILNRLSQYLGFKDYEDFSRTVVKDDEQANKTTIKIRVDEDEESISEKFSKLIINITNEQHFKMPEFIKQNGLGIMEMILLVCLVTGNVVFSNSTKAAPQGFLSSLNSQPEKECMYWDENEYKLADCNDKNPLFDLKPLNPDRMKFFKRITRKDTLTVENALGKTWYSKYNGEVEFFTDDGTDPNNGRELRKSTPFIINKYAGKQIDSLQIEE